MGKVFARCVDPLYISFTWYGSPDVFVLDEVLAHRYETNRAQGGEIRWGNFDILGPAPETAEIGPIPGYEG